MNMPPNDELELLEAEYWHHLHLLIILMGDLNANLDDLTSNPSIAITTTIEHWGNGDFSMPAYSAQSHV